MESTDALRFMIDKSGKSALSVGRALGHSQSWAYMSTRTGRDPKLSTVAEVARETGFDVALLKADTGEVMATIDPPERTERNGSGKAEVDTPKSKGSKGSKGEGDHRA